ncbi:MAG TPA: response regulator [Ktedonobacteraceae bacterium]|jgi:DNA-binding response OmpR family regulator|nr:response regulator [Ktedonobacteraceae bacterium]
MEKVSVGEVKRAARILVVEDDVDIQHVWCVYLQHSGFDVKSATDGQEAIHLIPEYRPDLIVLDLMMRPVDGWAVLQWLRVQQIKPMIPVLVLTALYQLSQQIKGFEEGAIDYLTKPTQPSIIVDHIRKILGLSEEQRAMLQRARIEHHRKLLERVSAPSPDEFAY